MRTRICRIRTSNDKRTLAKKYGGREVLDYAELIVDCIEDEHSSALTKLYEELDVEVSAHPGSWDFEVVTF